MSRPSPATVIALIALVVVCGGVAVAAIPGPDGRIHACYGSDQVLRVAHHNGRCRDGTTRLVWNQQGVPGAPGAPGVSKYKVVSAETPTLTGSSKDFSVACPSGLDVLGGGASVHSSGGQQRLARSVPRKRKGTKAARWLATGRRGTSSGKWFMRAYAICASVKP